MASITVKWDTSTHTVSITDNSVSNIVWKKQTQRWTPQTFEKFYQTLTTIDVGDIEAFKDNIYTIYDEVPSLSSTDIIPTADKVFNLMSGSNTLINKKKGVSMQSPLKVSEAISAFKTGYMDGFEDRISDKPKNTCEGKDEKYCKGYAKGWMDAKSVASSKKENSIRKIEVSKLLERAFERGFTVEETTALLENLGLMEEIVSKK